MAETASEYVVEKYFESEPSVLKGRQKLIANKVIKTDADLLEVLSFVLPIHFKNAYEIRWLKNYDKGIQPILNREKTVRPDINNRVVENHAHEIVEFKVGFEFGQPITYVQRDTTTDKEEQVNKLNEMFFNENKPSLDQELAENFKICGVGYRAILPNKEPDALSKFKLLNLEPENTFVVYSPDVYGKPVLAGTYYIVPEDTLPGGKIYAVIYTADYIYSMEGIANPISLGITDKEINPMGMIPIVEYVNDYQRMGCFERVIPLMDMLNVVESDRANGLSQFVQSFIWFDNVDIDATDFDTLMDKGGIVTKSTDGLQANIKAIQNQLDQSDSQSLSDNIYDMILRLTATPGREQSTGGNTGQAIMLGGSGWQLAEEAATRMEPIFKQSDRETLRIAIHLAKQLDVGITDLTISDIDIKFARNKVSNLLTKTQGLLNMLQAGVHPQVAITNSDLFSDPQQVYKVSEPYLSKWLADAEAEISDDDMDIENTTEQSVAAEKPETAIEPEKAEM